MAANLSAALRWTYGASALNLVMQFGFVAVVGRLVDPVAYGTVAVAAGVVGYVALVSDLGVGQAAMRDRGLEPGDLWGVALVALLVNLVIAAAIVAAAAPLARWLALPPHGVAVLRALALSAPLCGVASAAQAWLNRDMAFRRLALLSVVAKLVGQGLVVVPLAWAGLGVWALVAGALAQPALAIVLGLALARPRRPVWSRWPQIRAALRLGANFSVIRVLDATQVQVVSVAVATLAGTAAAGLLDRGSLFTLVLADMLLAGVARVLMPLYCRLNAQDPAALAPLFLGYFRRVCCLGLPVAAGLAAAATPVVLTMLGPDWADLVAPLRLLAAMAACRVVSVMAGGVVESAGNLRVRIGLGAAVVAASVLVLLLWRPETLSAILAVAVAAELARAMANVSLAFRAVGLAMAQLVRPLLLALSVSMVVGLAAAMASVAVETVALRLALAVLAAGGAALLALLAHPDRQLRTEMRGLMRAMIGRSGV